ncbi:MAG: hypothetical protein PHC53_02695 [Patescibacteria group bacterium]|nr:hypothetical protein [Patescibacteria group bacterium]
MPYCLVKPLADAFKKALVEGKIDPQKLADMTSKERHAFFEEIVGKDNAGQVNSLFESKLLLKDVERGMINWAKQVTGIKPEVRNDLISRIQKMDERILNPENQKAFMEDLAARRLGIDVTLEEAKQITELSINLAKAKENIANDRLAYGAAKVAMENYLNDLKREANKLSLDSFRASPVGASVQAASEIAGFAKSMKATLDVSALGRQGFKAIFTHPKQWATGAAQTFRDIWITLKNKTSEDVAMDAVKAEIYSRENAVDGTYKRMKLDIGTGEEAYPTSLPEKIPAFGRVFKASEVAYNGFLTRLRADIADRYIQIALDNGVDLKDSFQAEAIGRLVNSLTGRGSLGRLESTGKVINTMFFAPKNVKANFDFLTAHTFEKTSGFARKQAAYNLLKVVGGIAGILAIAKAINKDSVELDPRSSDFGKVRWGNTSFEVSGGMSSLVTFASRLISGSSKSSTTGRITKYKSGFGQTTRFDALISFITNKASPAFSVGVHWAKDQDSNFEKPTIQGELYNAFVPLPITNAIELLKDPDSAPDLIAMMADAFGIATNTYKRKR